MQHRLRQLQALSEVQRVQRLLVGLDDAERAGVRAAERHLAAVGGGVRVLGEVGEHLGLIAGGDADQSAVLGGEQDAAVPEPADQRALHLARDGVAVVVGGPAAGHGDGVCVRQPQPVPLRALRQQTEVAAAVQQIVHELPAGGLLLPYSVPLGALVPLGEGVHRLCDGGQDGVRRDVGAGGPVGAGLGQVRGDEGPQAEPGLGGPLAQGTAGVALRAGEPAAGGGGVGEDAGVTREVLLESVRPRHARSPSSPQRCAARVRLRCFLTTFYRMGRAGGTARTGSLAEGVEVSRSSSRCGCRCAPIPRPTARDVGAPSAAGRPRPCRGRSRRRTGRPACRPRRRAGWSRRRSAARP